jgi:hypothetical protein
MTQHDTHRYFRETFSWGSSGKDGKQPLKWRTLENISDEHLVNITNHIRVHINKYGRTILGKMIKEQSYRRVNNITIKDY